jgi:triphosphoribosyl-dephospho-CoA synthase
MRASVALLPTYYADLLARLPSERPLGSCVEAGRLAEARMLARVRANAHRGYIFLSGLALVGFHRAQGRLGRLPGAMAEAAREFFRAAPPEPSHGRRACRRFPVGGIRAETEAGLPSVFETAWPRYAGSLRRDADWARAAFAAMAALMQRVEDTTALHRCGLDGLERLRRDGRDLETLLERGGDPRPFLEKRNEAYRRLNLTMGGVADCLALTMALHACFGGPPHLRTGEEL